MRIPNTWLDVLYILILFGILALKILLIVILDLEILDMIIKFATAVVIILKFCLCSIIGVLAVVINMLRLIHFFIYLGILESKIMIFNVLKLSNLSLIETPWLSMSMPKIYFIHSLFSQVYSIYNLSIIIGNSR